MESMKNYVQEMLKKLGAESMIENIQTQVKLKGIQAVSAMKIFQEKLSKTGNTYEVMNYLQKNYVQEKLKKLGAESMMENMQMQVQLKGIKAVTAMKNFQEKLDKTGKTYKVMNYLQQNYVPEKLNKLGAESMMENMQMQMKSKGIESVSAMEIYQEKLDKTGNTYEIMMNYLQQKLSRSQFIVIIIMVVILVVFVSRFVCIICRRKAGFKTMKAPGRKTGESISRHKFESNPRSYFQNLRGVLCSVPLATDDEGPSSPGLAKRRKTVTKAKSVEGKKNALVSAGGATEDDHIDLTRGADPMHADDDHTAGDSPVPDLRFLAAHARRDMEAMRSCVISHMSEGISRRNIEDIEKVLAVYNRKVLTLEDSLVKACKRTVTNLEVIENEKSEEIHHLKKKNSSLRKSYEASEALVKEQEEEIDNLRSALAHAQHDAVENYKASSKYQQDLYAYKAESMSVSISLTKEWISTEHPGINPHSFDCFLARRRDSEQAAEQGQAAEQDGIDDHADDPLQEEDGASQLD